ncbi:hypothetical protein K502DRAFT_327826 [Neoconidiobolus thromboides FSU 785]|nr:hypothetical protein K502DRAFT_327826 [Neoconidiobolus thromboides FSU 785]
MNIQRICKALYKYEAVEEVDDSDEAWWKASTELNSTDEMNIGLIPYNYVEEIDYIAKYRAIYDYEAQGEDELSFEEGVEILVYQVEGEDWMLGCINGSFGFVPQNYTEEIIEDTNEQNNYAEEGYMEEYEDAVEEVEQELPQVSKNINESIDQHNTTPLSTKKIAKDDMLFWRVSEVDKSKKKKQKVRLGISSNMIFVASEEEKGSPVKQWAISDLVSYSLKNKHIIIELSGKDSVTFDFSCSSIKQAEAIAFKIKSCSDAIYREKAEDKNSKGFFGMFKKSTKSSAAPPKSYQQHSPQYNQSDDVPTIKDKYETVPLPPIPQEEIDRASEQQKQFYPETRTQLRVPSNNSISSTPSKAGNESKKGKPAIVVYDFDAAEEGELSVVADTRIYILDSDTDSDWWRCRIYRSDEDYDEGFVPAEYVTLLPSDAPQSSALAGGNNVANEPSSIMVREWTDTTGSFKVEAEFIKFSENKIHLHKVNGVKIAVPIEKMSMVDLKYVSELIGEDLTESLDSTRKQNAESEKWLRFFKDCNVADDEAQVYATTFTKEKIDRSLLKSMDKSSLKDLGLVEGDSIRVLNAIKSDNISKAPKGKRSVTFNPNTTVIDPSKDEELAYKLQQEEIERVRKEKASGSFVELQIEQDEMLARRLQGQGDSNSSWEGFSDLGTSSSESKKYGLGLSGGLGSKPKGKSSSIDQQKIAKATEFLEAENQKENKNKVKDDDKSKSKSKSKSGFDDDIWGVPGQRATYQKKTPPTVAKDITPASPTVVSPTVASPTTTKATITSDPWAVFPDSNTKPSSTASETPIFSSDNSVRRDTKGKSNSALDQDWSSLSAEFSKISVNDSATVKPIKVAPEVTKKGNQDFAVFTKVQQASPRRPSTPQLTQPQIQQSSSMFVQQQQMPTQQIQNNVPVILAQPLIPIPSGNLSNVFIPTRRPAPPKPTQNQNVFGDANATFSSNSSVSSLPVNNQSSKASDNMQVGASIFNQSTQNKESGSVFSTISTPNTQSNSNIFGSNSNTQPSVNVFGSSTTPSATLSNKSNGNVTTSNQEQALDLFGANSKTLSPMSDIKREGSMSSLASFNIPHNNSDSSSTPLNSSMLLNKNLDTFDSKNFNYKNDFAMDSPIISERSFSGNLHDTSMSTINLPSNMDYSISTTTTNRTKASSSNYQFDDLSLKSLGVTSTPKIPQYSSGNKNQNTQTQGSVNYNLGISQNSSTGLGSTFDSVPRLMDSTPVKLNEFDQFRMELDKPSSLNQSFDINTGNFIILKDEWTNSNVDI